MPKLIPPAAWAPRTAACGRPGHAPVTRKLTLAAGQKTALTIDAQSGDLPGGPAPPPTTTASPAAGPPPLRIAAYVAGGVGVAGLVTFGIAGIMARSTYNDLNGACGGGPCPADKTGEISSGKTQQTIANVGLIVGIAGVAAGGTLFVLSLPKGAATTTTGLAVSPGWVGVRGTW